MKNDLPIVYLARHGETAWTLSGQRTGLTDLPLTEHGERNARRLRERLQALTFAKVFTSPWTTANLKAAVGIGVARARARADSQKQIFQVEHDKPQSWATKTISPGR